MFSENTLITVSEKLGGGVLLLSHHEGPGDFETGHYFFESLTIDYRCTSAVSSIHYPPLNVFCVFQYMLRMLCGCTPIPAINFVFR